jgi:transcriptional regulator with XRE-family HTH domain
MTTSFFERLWKKLAKSKKYRSQFVAAHAKRAIPFQIRAMMKAKGLNQEKLADLSGLSQGVISRAADPTYGNLTINTIIKVASGLDVAYLGIFVPFSRLAEWVSNLSEASVLVDSFDEEDNARNARSVAHALLDAPSLGDINLAAIPDEMREIGKLALSGKGSPSAMDALTQQPTIQ